MKLSPIFGTSTVAAGPAAAPFLTPPSTAINAIKQVSKIRVQAPASNAAAVTVGTSSGQIWILTATGYPLELEAGDNDYFNLYDFFVNGTAGDKVNFIAIPCLR